MSFKITNICCIGAGYVGGPTMAVIASKCRNLNVTVVDINKERIDAWNNSDLDKLPVYEPGLDKLIGQCRNKNLYFTTDVQGGISTADMIFLSVNTPTKKKGIGAGQASDLKWIERSARQVALYAKSGTIVVEKSTLPVKTAETIKNILQESKTISSRYPDEKKFFVLSNPEFLAEGSAISDLINPDRVLIGGENDEAISALENIYLNWVEPQKIIKTNLWSSELSKLTANAFLAQRISSINAISALCEATGANINEVAKAIGMDKRIGSKFLESGPGFGGSCFKKDILNLVYLCNFYGLKETANYWQTVIDINNWQQERISRIIIHKLFGTLSGKKISILGFAFKAKTNDIRESPAINICLDLLEEGAELNIYEPKVSKNQIEKALNQKENELKIDSKWSFSQSVNESVKDSDAIVIITEWQEFKYLEWEKISSLMRKPSWLFDLRSIADSKEAKFHGINVWKVGLGDLD